MKAYLFETKRASAVFLKAFCEKLNHEIFACKETDKSPGKGGVMPNISPAWEGNKTVNLTCQENASRMFANLALTDCLPSCGKNTKC